MTESYCKLMSDTKPKIHKAQSTSRRINVSKTTNSTFFKLQKIKDKKNSERNQGGIITLSIQKHK